MPCLPRNPAAARMPGEVIICGRSGELCQLGTGGEAGRARLVPVRMSIEGQSRSRDQREGDDLHPYGGDGESAEPRRHGEPSWATTGQSEVETTHHGGLFPAGLYSRFT